MILPTSSMMARRGASCRSSAKDRYRIYDLKIPARHRHAIVQTDVLDTRRSSAVPGSSCRDLHHRL